MDARQIVDAMIEAARRAPAVCFRPLPEDRSLPLLQQVEQQLLERTRPIRWRVTVEIRFDAEVWLLSDFPMKPIGDI
jgi:hypothetical protein